MLRFVDLTLAYWPYEESASPCCVIVDTVTDTCLVNELGAHVLDSLDEVREAGGERAAALVPNGFFEGRSGMLSATRRLRALAEDLDGPTTTQYEEVIGILGDIGGDP